MKPPRLAVAGRQLILLSALVAIGPGLLDAYQGPGSPPQPEKTVEAKARIHGTPRVANESLDGLCSPIETAMVLNGHEVAMCWRAPDGREGHAQAGIWSSGQAGLLWFFNRDNAEVLIKVLDGCSNNGHRWVFVAPVTTVEFNLRVTAPNGDRWSHGNVQGVTASARSDVAAFACSTDDTDGDEDNEDDGDEGDGPPMPGAEVVEYRYDDGRFEAYTRVRDVHEMEYAQQFLLSRGGRLAHVTACFRRPSSDESSELAYNALFYLDDEGAPGSQLAAYDVEVSLPERGDQTCFKANIRDPAPEVTQGPVWVGIRWPGRGKRMGEDIGPGERARTLYAYRETAADDWSSWESIPEEDQVKAFGIRLGVRHSGAGGR